MLEFVYESEDDDKEEFEAKWCRRPVALNGIRIQLREKGGDAYWSAEWIIRLQLYLLNAISPC